MKRALEATVIQVVAIDVDPRPESFLFFSLHPRQLLRAQKCKNRLAAASAPDCLSVLVGSTDGWLTDIQQDLDRGINPILSW